VFNCIVAGETECDVAERNIPPNVRDMMNLNTRDMGSTTASATVLAGLDSRERSQPAL